MGNQTEDRETRKRLAEASLHRGEKHLSNFDRHLTSLERSKVYGRVFLIGASIGLGLVILILVMLGKDPIIAPAVITGLITGIFSLVAEYIKEHVKRNRSKGE